MKRWMEDVGRLAGDGTLSDSAGRTIQVVYVVGIQREVGVDHSVDAPGVPFAGKYQALGVLTRDPGGEPFDLNSPLQLTLDNGRTLEIAPTTTDPGAALISFRVPTPEKLFRDDARP